MPMLAMLCAILAFGGVHQDAQPLKLSHCWVVVKTGAKERSALEAAGFTISPVVNRHDGQGTASVTAELLNGFIELIYPDPTVTVSPDLKVAAEKFILKSNWRESGYSPIGIIYDRTATTPATFPFETWKVQAPWMNGSFIEMLTPRTTPKAVSLSISSHPGEAESDNAKLFRDPLKGAMFHHKNGALHLTSVKVIAPNVSGLPPSAKYLSDHGLLTTGIGSDWLLEITLDNGKKHVTKDLRPALPIIVHY